jgi:hypothetical protein
VIGLSQCGHLVMPLSALASEFARRVTEEYRMNMKTTALCVSLLTGAMTAPAALAQDASQPISEQEAHAIGVDAYLYFYPLISTDITRLTSTNIEAGR